MPAVLIPLYWQENIPEEKMLEAMFTASGIGAVIAFRPASPARRAGVRRRSAVRPLWPPGLWST